MKIVTTLTTMGALLGVAGTLAHAGEQRSLFPDSAVVGAVRPLAFGAALKRMGSGWEALVRRSLPLPGSVSPFDPVVLSMTGIDPAGVVWVGARALRGGTHVRAVLPVVNPYVAQALVQTAGPALGISLTAGPANTWTGRTKDGMPLVVRLDGQLLVVDYLMAGPTSIPTPADIARVVPLRPPHGWVGTHGAQKRMTAADAVSVWADLDAVAKLGMQRTEVQLSSALHNVDPSQRVALAREGHKELAACKSALDRIPHAFDDVFFALSVQSPDVLRAEIASSGRRASLDSLRALRTAATPTRQLSVDGTPDLSFSLTAPPVPRAAATHQSFGSQCMPLSTGAAVLWGWPSLWASAELPEWARLLGGLRALLVTVPSAETDDAPIASSQVLGLAELDPAMSGDLDRVLAQRGWSASTPLRIGSRTISTYTTPYDGLSLVLDPSTESKRGTVLGLGTRELLRPAFEHDGPRSGDGDGSLAQLSITGRGLRRIAKQAHLSRREASLIDGVSQVDGRAVLDADLLRGDVELQLAPRKP